MIRRRPRDIFGPLHKWGHPLNDLHILAEADTRIVEQLEDLSTHDSITAQRELTRLDNISDQLGAVIALLEDLRNEIRWLTPTERKPAE